MSRPVSSPQRSLHLAGIVILIAGWIAAAIVFLVASASPQADGADYQLINGQVYSVPLDSSKREQQQLARLGGSASVRIVEFDTWLGSLWHGERLAYTLALLATVVAGACFYLADLAGEEAGE